MKKLVLPIVFILSLIPHSSFANFLNDIATAGGVNVQCERNRKDAKQHQKELDIQKAAMDAHLNTTNAQLNLAHDIKQELESRKNKLDKRMELYNEFQKISTDLIINEQFVKSLIFNLQSNNSSESLKEILQGMETDTQNPNLQFLAQILKQLTQKNSAEISALLVREDGKILLQQLRTLIGSFQVYLTEDLASYETGLNTNTNNILVLQQTQASLIQSIQNNRALWARQEERTSCR